MTKKLKFEKLYIRETYCEVKKLPDIENESYDNEKSVIYGESSLYEPFTTDIKKLFKSLSREYGKCISSLYNEINGKVVKIGWVFRKLAKYSDSNDTYLQETWVELHTDKPTVKTNYHYANI